ncbi:MAG: PEP-CTERM sorting domain-containing protein [Verrucomicrobiota bacterium]
MADFESPTFSAGPVAGQDGWTITPSPPDFQEVGPSIGEFGGGGAAYFGPIATPPQDEIEMTRFVGSTLLSGGSFSVDFSLQPSFDPANDGFEFIFLSSDVVVGAIAFVPPSSQPAPGLNIFITDLAGSEDTGLAALYQRALNLTLDFSSDGSGGTDVEFSIFDYNTPGTSTFTGNFDGVESIDELGIAWIKNTGDSVEGDSFIIFDNLSFIPEPSSLLLAMFGAVFALRRRR